MTWQGDDFVDEGDFDDAIDAEASAAEADAAGHEPPSFAAIVARAHRIDPSAIAASSVELAQSMAIVPRRHGGASDGGAEALGGFIEELRESCEDDIARRARAGIPPMARPRTAATFRLSVVLGALAAAAVVVLGLDWAEGWRARREQVARDSSQSVSAVRDEAELHQATPAEPASITPAQYDARPRPAALPSPVAPSMAPIPASPTVTSPVRIEPPAASPSPAARAVARAATPRVPADAPLRRLDIEAQAARSTGDLDRADALYAELIARGQRHPLVELAYGERFTLARRSGASVQRKLWNAYLSTYPEGRFADDAKAGLCRTAPAEDKSSCWQGYLERFPSGTYSAHAQRWLADPSAP